LIIFEPAMLKYRYIDDTSFYKMDEKSVSQSHERIDGTKEEWLTECGLEFHHPTKFGFLSGLNQANVV
jgi:hypothetical protein